MLMKLLSTKLSLGINKWGLLGLLKTVTWFLRWSHTKAAWILTKHRMLSCGQSSQLRLKSIALLWLYPCNLLQQQWMARSKAEGNRLDSGWCWARSWEGGLKMPTWVFVAIHVSVDTWWESLIKHFYFSPFSPTYSHPPPHIYTFK